MNRNLQRTYQRVLYSLKKQYGDEAIVCQNTSVSSNYVTGEKSYTCTRTKVSKAILLPVEITRKTSYTISPISVDKLFVFGGTFDVGSRIVVIDTRDLPEFFQITPDDWLLIHQKRYEIDTIEQLEYQAGWVLGTKEIMGVTPDLEVALSASDSVGLSDSGLTTKDAERSIEDTLSLATANNAVKDAERSIEDTLSLATANNAVKE